MLECVRVGWLTWSEDDSETAVLSETTVPARLHSRDVIGDLGTLIDIHAEWVAA